MSLDGPQAEEKTDLLKRALADMENLRQRSARQAEQTKKFAVQVGPHSSAWLITGQHGVELENHPISLVVLSFRRSDCSQTDASPHRAWTQ